MDFDFTSPSSWGKRAQENGWRTSINPKTGVQSKGLLDTGIDVGSAIADALMGYQNYQLALDKYNTDKKVMATNLQMAKDTQRGNIMDRAAARYAASGNTLGASSQGEYIKQQLAQYGMA